jgi:asparagine synthetase B (glutamine-hydrolysing)
MMAAPERSAVSNWIWPEDSTLPEPAAHFAARRLPAVVAGQFAVHTRIGSETHVLTRDPLGVNKLFVAVRDGEVDASNYWIELVRRGHRAANVWSVPAGHALVITPGARSLSLERYAPITFNDAPCVASLDVVVARIQQSLSRTFGRIQASTRGRPIYVTLSGGLDSTVVAVLAREWLGAFTAVTFAVDDEREPSEDLASASRVATELGVPLVTVRATPSELVDLLDPVLLYGQDWRDFNVHCGIVNAAIGQALQQRHASAEPALRPVLLTGDVMNELMADYTPVVYRGREYYALPRVPPGQLRRFLVQGLDAGDREIGIFAHYGLDAIQPYALCAPAYAAVPAGVLQQPAAKQQIVRRVMGARVPPYIYDRTKTRAQVGGPEAAGSTLAIFADRGLDAAQLQTRFGQLFGLAVPDLSRLIRGGVYRIPTSFAVFDG